jgi:hypothetical protein
MQFTSLTIGELLDCAQQKGMILHISFTTVPVAAVATGLDSLSEAVETIEKETVRRRKIPVQKTLPKKKVRSIISSDRSRKKLEKWFAENPSPVGKYKDYAAELGCERATIISWFHRKRQSKRKL